MSAAGNLIPVLASALCAAASVRGAPPSPGAADPPAAGSALSPNLLETGDAALLTWFEPAEASGEGGVYRLRFASFAAGTWSAPVTIAQRDDFFVNWADVPSAARAEDGSLVVHWPQKSGDETYAYDVVLARSTDGGESWQLLGPAHDDGTRTEHGFVSLVPEADGVRAFWLDGRAMAGGGEPGTGTMMLRTALIGDSVGRGSVLDERVCECCSTSAAVTDDGPLVVFRDRSAEEVRDISIVRRVGGTWTAPETLHADDWLIAGCPVNGPAVAAAGRLVVVAWYTGAGGSGAVRAAFSADAGAAFSRPITVDDAWPLGRVDVALDGAGGALVLWLDAGPDGGAIMLRRVSSDGHAGTPLRLAGAGTSRAAGFPKMARLDSTLLVVWTEEGEVTRLRGVTLPLDDVDPER